MHIKALPQLGNRGSYLIQQMNDKLVEHKQYIHDNGIDMPEIRDWKWHLPEDKIRINLYYFFIFLAELCRRKPVPVPPNIL